MQRLSRRNAFAWIFGVLVVGAGSLVRLIGSSSIAVAVMIATGLAVTGYAVFRYTEQTRHDSRMREFAQSHGWTYSMAGTVSVAGLHGFPFGMGQNRTVADCLEGTYSGKSCASYTYSFEQRVGTSQTVEQIFTVTQVQLDARYPRLDLVPEDPGTRVLSQVGLADIDLESAEFNRKWRVLCDNRRYAIDVVDPRMMQVLLAGRQQGVAVRLDGDRVIAWSAGIANVKDLSARLNLVVGVAKAIPAHVVRTYSELDAQRRAEEAAREANAPGWAKAGGVLNSGRYTGIGVDADGNGVDDWDERTR